MSFTTNERRFSTNRTSNPERALSPPRAGTGSDLQKAIEARLHGTIETPETTKSQGRILELETKHLDIPEGPANARPATPTSPSLAPAPVDEVSAKKGGQENNGTKVYRVGDIWAMQDGRVVKVSYIGTPNPPFLAKARNINDKKWVGLEVIEGQGKNDGKGPRGRRYFKCQPGKGLFMRQKDFKNKINRGDGPVRHEVTEILEGDVQQSFGSILPGVITATNRSRSQSNPQRPAPRKRRAAKNFNPFKQTRYDLKGHGTMALSQKRMRKGVPSGSRPGRDERAAAAGVGFVHKSGPRAERLKGGRVVLASERAGIQSYSASNTPQQELNFKMRYDTKGFTATALSQKDVRGHYKSSTGGGAGYGGKKLGPRAIRLQGDQTKLASEMAGIAPMTAQQSAAHRSSQLYKPHYDTKGFTATALSQKDLHGHYKQSTGGGAGYGGHKLGPRAIRQQGDRTKLASEMAGIKPMTASQSAAYAAEDLYKPHYDTKGFTATALSQKDLHGHYKQSTGGGAGYGGHKLGPRAIRQQGDRTKLASEMAGIKPMTASQSAADAAEDLYKPHYDTKGFTATALSQKDLHGHYKESTGGGAGYGGHKLGPRAIRQQGDRTKLASEMAGIKPMTAQQSAAHRASDLYNMRYDTKGFTATALSQKDLHGHYRANHMSIGGGGGFMGHKLGPRAIRQQGDHTKLASEMAGIQSYSASNTPQQELNFQMRYDTKGFTSTALSQKDLHGHHKESTGGGAGFSGHKMGPREIRRQGDHTKLASEEAGIKPMTASQSAAYKSEDLYKPMRYDTKGFTATAVSQKDLHGHYKESTGGGAGFGGKKLGPRAIRLQGDRTKLASEEAGIKPMTAQQSAAHRASDLYKPMRYDTKGFTATAVSQKDLRGHYKESTGGGAGFSGHKMGPREIRQQGNNTMLASEQAGIAPMHASQSAAYKAEDLYKPMRYDTKGFTSTAIKESSGGASHGGHKMGPREIRRQGDHTQLASEQAGIAPMTASQSAANRAEDLYKPMRYDTAGFTSTSISRKNLNSAPGRGLSGFNAPAGRKLGPREIGRGGQLASNAAGIQRATAQQSAANKSEDLFKPRHDTKGFSTTYN